MRDVPKPLDRGAGSGGSLSVKPADLENRHHAAAVVDLLDAYALDPMGGGRALPETTRGRLAGALRSFPGTLVLLAFLDSYPVGVAVCFPGFSTFRAQPLINIHDLAVLPAYRGRGVGSALLQEVEAQALARGCCKVTLEVREDNQVARSLYRRAGFGAGRSGGEPVQYLFLEKPIRVRDALQED